MTFDYYILNPTGNITALVTNDINPRDYVAVSSEIMRLHPEVEQVGFVNLDGEMPYLRMCGGEFCGNATMSTAALFCALNNINSAKLSVSVFGRENPITVYVSKSESFFSCKLLMEKPERIEVQNFEVDGEVFTLPIVYFKGISHIISNADFDEKIAEKILKKYCEKLSVSAIGFMLYDGKNKSMRPIVYVKGGNTLFYENSCASGSCAACAYLTKDETTEKEVVLKQPGGVLTTSSGKNISFISLSGRVEITDYYSKEI